MLLTTAAEKQCTVIVGKGITGVVHFSMSVRGGYRREEGDVVGGGEGAYPEFAILDVQGVQDLPNFPDSKVKVLIKLILLWPLQGDLQTKPGIELIKEKSCCADAQAGVCQGKVCICNL